MGRYLDIARQRDPSSKEFHSRHNGLLKINQLREENETESRQESSTKETNSTKEGSPPHPDTLEASRHRLEAAGVSIVVLDTGDMQVVHSDLEASAASAAGFAVYSSADLYYVVQLTPAERRLFHSFKKRYGGTTQWTEHRQ